MKKSFYLAVLFLISTASFGQLSVTNLVTENQEVALGIDVTQPRFSWQMVAPTGQRGVSQGAFQIVVKDSKGATVWDSRKITTDVSLNVPYSGSALQPTTRYTWTLSVWDQNDVSATGSAWFETGLMDPDPNLSAWSGATWIGGGSEDLVFNSHYQSIYQLQYTQAIAAGSTKASFILGANDARLMDKDKNIMLMENGKDESYVKLELDISEVNGSPEGRAKLNVYRVGFTNNDKADEPFESFAILPSIINNSNKNTPHTVEINSTFGGLSLTMDGVRNFSGMEAPARGGGRGGRGGGGNFGPSANINPLGGGGNFTTYGMLADIGFHAPAGQKASFSNVSVSFSREPFNKIFNEDLSKPAYDGIFAGAAGLTVANGTYQVDGGTNGVFIARNPSRNSTPILRTEFSAEAKQIDHARLYVTARGIYEMYLNGSRVGNDYYNPGLTQYNKTHFYQTYDVTNMITQGENALGAMLGEGWWSGLLSFGSILNHFGDRQSLLAKLVITYQDGTTSVVATNDQSWKYYSQGPILYSSLDLGEVYDARRDAAVQGWSTTAYNDNAWKSAVKVGLEATYPDITYEGMQLIGQIGDNAGVYQTLTAKSVQEVREGVYVYDMGQNIVGVPRITFANGTAGNKVTLRFAEMLYPDLPESGGNVGMIMQENLRAAISIDEYTMKNGAQTFQPRFTSHGYQYVEITGVDEPLPLSAVQGQAISSILELTASYNTSNAQVNKLWSNLVWSNIDNFLTIPTDCPQRNERMGWSGDINVFSRTATYVSNADQFLRRHMYAMRDVQTEQGRFTDIAPIGGGFGGVLWGSAGIVVPWEDYLQYNNVTLLQEHYDAMAAYIDYLQTTIDPDTGMSRDGTLGDWLGPQNNKLGSAFLVTAYHIYDLWIMTQVAMILGKSEDVSRFMKMHEDRKTFFNRTFVNDDHKTLGYGSGGFGGGGGNPQEFRVADTQTSYAVGLGTGAFSDENIPFMVQNLADAVRRVNTDDSDVERPEYSLMTGFIGTSWINKVLSDYGHVDLSYRLLQNDQYPSWLYAIDQGATSIWERLNGYTVEEGFGGNNGMNSFNHYSFGAIGQWMMGYSLGIQRDMDNPGFKHFILQPEPDPTGEMTFAEGYYDSMYGRISSSWRVSNGTLTYSATVPANTTATLYIPAKSEKVVKESGKRASKKVSGISFLRFENGKAVYELQSGTYAFTATL